MDNRAGNARAPRPNTVRCRCKSHCTTYNRLAGTFEGDGCDISRSMRDRHAADDKSRAIRTAMRSIMTLEPLLGGSHPNWIKIVNDELDFLDELPVTSLTQPLVFVNPPAQNGNFTWPDEEDEYIPNSRLHSLTGHRYNHAFLSIEQRVVELSKSLAMRMVDSDDVVDLTNRLKEKLRHLLAEKDSQWSQQQGPQGVNFIYVNTGVFEVYFVESITYTL